MTLPYPSSAPDNAPPPAPRCANCGCEVPRRFCGECGQQNATRLVAVRRILWDAMDDQLSVNSALPRTLKGCATAVVQRLGEARSAYSRAVLRIARQVDSESGSGEVIAHAVWLYLRFPLSLRDVEEILAGRGIGVTHETIRCWVTKFGSQFASRLRKREARPGRV